MSWSGKKRWQCSLSTSYCTIEYKSIPHILFLNTVRANLKRLAYGIIDSWIKNMKKISQDLGVTLKQIDTVLSLTAEGATIPFIARYRKDMTGSLDEVTIKAIIDLDKSLTNLNDRKEAVLAKIQEQGKLTKELEEAILAAEN